MMNTFKAIFRTRIRKKFQYGPNNIKLSNKINRRREREIQRNSKNTHLLP